MNRTHPPRPAAPHTLSRRRLLQLAGSGYMGLSLPGLLQAQAAVPNRPPGTIRACIFLFYYGGPSHLDTFDLKPDAPAEVRGEFKPIATSAPGVRICEHLPRLAKCMHKVALVRSVNHIGFNDHDAACAIALTGRMPLDGIRARFKGETHGFPSHGAALSYLWREKRLAVPHAALPFVMRNEVKSMGQSPGFLGMACAPFLIEGDPATLAYRAGSLERPVGVPDRRLADRTRLLTELERLRDLSGTRAPTAAMQDLYAKAFDLMNSEAVRRALDLEREGQATRDRYGYGPRGQHYEDGPDGNIGAHLGFARNMRGLNLLLARRLVEAGVPFVNVYDCKQNGKNWDTHDNNFVQLKDHLLPLADQGLSALIEDLDARGLLDSTLVVAVGEFGRTPRVTSDAGRGHWSQCYTALLAGGGVQGGAVCGASDKVGAYPADDPVSPADLAATIFWRFGIDPATAIHDQAGRPFPVAEGHPIRKLFALHS